jgi:hypothetical protein
MAKVLELRIVAPDDAEDGLDTLEIDLANQFADDASACGTVMWQVLSSEIREATAEEAAKLEDGEGCIQPEGYSE